MQSVINTATAATVRQISHTHTHTNICALQHMNLHNLHTHTRALTHKLKCERACNMHSHTTATLVKVCCPPTHTPLFPFPANTQGLTMKQKSSLFRLFSCSSLSVFCTSDQECTQARQRARRGKNIFTFLLNVLQMTKNYHKEIFYTEIKGTIHQTRCRIV